MPIAARQIRIHHENPECLCAQNRMQHRSVQGGKMTRKRRHLLRFLCAVLVCQAATAQTTVDYEADASDFVNPERGFYRYSETPASSHVPLVESVLRDNREPQTPFGANYSIRSSLVYRYFILYDFLASGVSSDFLYEIAADFANARNAGVKVIPRFAYTITPIAGDCPAMWVCPPYGDTTKTWVLNHVDDLQAVLEANQDVIAAVQMGFIGIWGENYYTDYFGDPSVNGTGFLSSANWTDRKEVLARLLATVPESRMVQVRYPQKKQKFIYGNGAGTSPAASPPITAAQAHDGSDIARIGLHNDCLLAGPDDFGTYFNYDNPPVGDVANLKPYFAAETKYVVAGGETCADDYNPTNDCSSVPGGTADIELKDLHYTYLNADYSHAVNNDWQDDGCMDDIKKELGYRLALSSGTYTDEARPGQSISLEISLTNQGYAAPFNARGVELVLRSTTSNDEWFAMLPDDPRFWLGEGAMHDVDATVCIPPNVPIDSYELLLNLPDPFASIYHRPEYSIRLASKLPGGAASWEELTGYNKLGHTVMVNDLATRPACSGETGFLAASGYSDQCVADLSIEGVSITAGNYQATGELSASDTTIKSGNPVLFQSDSRVALGGGFSVENGAAFTVAITPCNPPGPASGTALGSS